MLIDSLDTMENIVKNNRSLSWNGWDVVELTKSPTAMFKRNGSYVNGKWYLKNTFTIERDGWRIPKKYMR